MLYHSTRCNTQTVDSADAVIRGLAPDGGLYMPRALPAFDAHACLQKDFYGMASQILSAFLPAIPNMDALVEKAYRGKFSAQELTPTVQAGDFSVLELFHGPTSAFKDVALCMLPQLLTAARRVKGMEKELMILTATSGDTGKAALEGFKDVEGIGITVFYPNGGVSKVQRAQMVTQEGSNVHVCAVKGNFDDAQTGVKNIFAACADRTDVQLSSANSINIGRLVPQITYYFKAYRDLLDAGRITLGEKVNFSVPTGNFGDILAGYLAKRLGLPVGRLICASNANNVLTDFIRTGTYDRRRALLKTQSPSMDILVSSNLERLLYLLSGDTALVSDLMTRLSRDGSYTVPASLLAAIQAEFWAGCCNDSAASAAIGRIWKNHHYLTDPHTACGWVVAEDYVNQTGDTAPLVVLSTASPYKFPTAVLEAIGKAQTSNVSDPIEFFLAFRRRYPVEKTYDEFLQMDLLEFMTDTPIPENLKGLRSKAERHTGVIAKDKMLDFVLQCCR